MRWEQDFPGQSYRCSVRGVGKCVIQKSVLCYSRKTKQRPEKQEAAFLHLHLSTTYLRLALDRLEPSSFFSVRWAWNTWVHWPPPIIFSSLHSLGPILGTHYPGSSTTLTELRPPKGAAERCDFRSESARNTKQQEWKVPRKS